MKHTIIRDEEEMAEDLEGYAGVGDKEGKGAFILGGNWSKSGFSNRGWHYNKETKFKEIKSLPCTSGYGVGGRLRWKSVEMIVYSCMTLLNTSGRYWRRTLD